MQTKKVAGSNVTGKKAQKKSQFWLGKKITGKSHNSFMVAGNKVTGEKRHRKKSE